jgi:hypothetical protein
MQVWAYLPAITIPLLGDLLAGRIDISAVGRVATPTEEEFLTPGRQVHRSRRIRYEVVELRP